MLMHMKMMFKTLHKHSNKHYKQMLKQDVLMLKKQEKALDKLRPEKLSKIGLIYLLKFLKTNFFL